VESATILKVNYLEVPSTSFEKLGMDFASPVRLRRLRRWRMDDPEDQENRAELISRMFALLTAKLEDAATIAAECQARLSPAQLLEGAAKLEDLVSQTATVAAAVSALLIDRGAAYDE
jgi:hypothetical protein